MRTKVMCLMVALVALVAFCAFTGDWGILNLAAFGAVGMALDPTLSAELDKDWAAGVRFAGQGHQQALERQRGNFDQDGRAIGAAIASVMVQASIPDQAMNNKLADRTPSGPAQGLSAPNPQTPAG